MQKKWIIITGCLVILGCKSISSPANATWFDSATGQAVQVSPRDQSIRPDRDHAVFGGHDLYWDKECKTWRDVATGNEIRVSPREQSIRPDQNHTVFGGHDLYWVPSPCPPPTQTAASTGLYLGGELVKNWGSVRSTERRAGTDIVTNEFTDRADPIGGGVLIGYRFTPFSNSIVASPFASFDFMRAPVNHTFANGSYLGTTANFMGTLGVKVGPQFDAFWLYGIAGLSVLNQTLNINFIPVSSSQSATVPGGTLGLGGAWRPGFLQGFGRPVSVFAEYQHFWWADATFNAPAASPGFNYTFRRQDDLLKVGFTVDLSPPPIAPPRVTLPVK